MIKVPELSGLSICIGIPTLGRPKSLKRLLLSLNAMKGLPNTRIVVIDNEGGQGAAFSVVSQLRKVLKFEISVYPEERKGISFARNQILHKAFEEFETDYLVMIDDDEVVDENWVFEIVSCSLRLNADVVSGRIIPLFEGMVDQHQKALRIYSRDRFTKEGLIDFFDNTGSILLSREGWLRAKSPYFDIDFERGGDTEFLYRLKDLGLDFAFAFNAISFEIYTEDRVNAEWISRRTKQYGNVYMKILLKHKKRFKIFFQLLYCIVLIAALVPLKFTFKKKFAPDSKLTLKLLRQLGKIEGYLDYSAGI